jgi:hypothetical protein
LYHSSLFIHSVNFPKLLSFSILIPWQSRQRGGQEIEIKFTLDYKANESIFWHIFKELSKNDNNNNGLVSYDKLQERLIATGKFYSGEAVLMIEHMEESGKIEQTEQYHVYRIGKPVTIQEEEWGNMR